MKRSWTVVIAVSIAIVAGVMLSRASAEDGLKPMPIVKPQTYEYMTAILYDFYTAEEVEGIKKILIAKHPHLEKTPEILSKLAEASARGTAVNKLAEKGWEIVPGSGGEGGIMEWHVVLMRKLK